MKKILSFILVVFVTASMCLVTVSAQTVSETELEALYLDFCKEMLYASYDSYISHEVEVEQIIELEDTVVFTATCFAGYEDYTYKIMLDDWNVVAPRTGSPTPLGVFVKSGDKVYDYVDAYINGIVNDPTVLLGFEGFQVYKTEIEILGDGKYERLFVERLKINYDESGDISEAGYLYKEIYEYYSEKPSSPDEATPDYVLVFAAHPYCGPMLNPQRIGEYVVFANNVYSPYSLGYHIYVPAEDKIYTLAQAYEAKIEGIDKAFTDSGIEAGPAGDADGDGRITVKDATYIQKLIAKLIPVSGDYAEYVFSDKVCDYNQDGKVTISDATCLQKIAAGIAWDSPDFI